MARLIKLVLLFAFFAVGTAMNYERKVKLMEATLRSGRIMGGSEAAVGQFPHQVSLKNLFGSHFCGGSVLSNRWVLTAAHCTEGESASNLVIGVGANVRSQLKTYRVSRYIKHPEYDDNELINDVAVILTVNEIALSEFVKPITLIDRLITSGSLLTSGWGRISESGAIPQELRYTETYVVSRADCERRLPGLTNPDTFCTFNARSIGICFGDSGGPLILPGDDGPLQVGITSFVIGTCGGGYPDGFASVDYHRDWILENTRNLNL